MSAIHGTISVQAYQHGAACRLLLKGHLKLRPAVSLPSPPHYSYSLQSMVLHRGLHGEQLLARQQQQRQGTTRRAGHVGAAVASATPAAAHTLWPALVQAWNTNPAAVLLAAGACILGVALSIFLLAAIPTMMAMRRSAHALERLLLTLEAEVPDTAATLRLSSMELADCIQEVGAFGADLTQGVRASARALSSAEQGLRQGASLVGKAMTGQVLPEVQDRVEAALKERARLDYTAAMVSEAMQTSKATARRLRFALAAGTMARGATYYLKRHARADAL